MHSADDVVHILGLLKQMYAVVQPLVQRIDRFSESTSLGVTHGQVRTSILNHLISIWSQQATDIICSAFRSRREISAGTDTTKQRFTWEQASKVAGMGQVHIR